MFTNFEEKKYSVNFQRSLAKKNVIYLVILKYKIAPQEWSFSFLLVDFFFRPWGNVILKLFEIFPFIILKIICHFKKWTSLLWRSTPIVTSANLQVMLNVTMSAFEYDFGMNETIILGVCSDSKNVKKHRPQCLNLLYLLIKKGMGRENCWRHIIYLNLFTTYFSISD